MHVHPPQTLNIARARDVPTLGEAASALLNVAGLPAPLAPVPQVQVLTASGADGALAARLFRPELARNTPVILYFPGGTWATGTLDQSDATARQLSARTGWIVVAMQPRLAPEATFPAAHDDAFALYQWARGHLREWGADPTRVVLAGEGPGANLALSTAFEARDRAAKGSPTPTPDALLLITPVAGTDLNTTSMGESGGSEPVQRSTLRWAQNLYAPDDLRDRRIDLARRTDFAGLPPTTIVLAEIDPSRSGGEILAAKLTEAGVPTQARLFPGTTAEFFGLGAQVPEARMAEDYAADRLRAGFDRMRLPPLASATRR